MSSGEWARQTPDGVFLSIKVIPRAGATKIAGLRDGRLLVRLAAAPVDDAANGALTRLLASTLQIAPRHITIVSGAHSRNKDVFVAGATLKGVRPLFREKGA